jgi:hypothetical protein
MPAEHDPDSDRRHLLAQVPVEYATPDPALLSKLPKPTRKNANKGLCNVCGGWHGLPAIHLDYMGHADVTLALIAIDPLFDYGWLTHDDGTMLIVDRSGRMVLEGWLEVHGVRRRCVGTCESGKMEPEKELIGDLLRNGAMRFGVATALWSKSDAHEGRDADDGEPAQEATPDEVAGDAASVRVGEIVKAVPGASDVLRALGAHHGKGFGGEALTDPAWRAIVLAELDKLAPPPASDATPGQDEIAPDAPPDTPLKAAGRQAAARARDAAQRRADAAEAEAMADAGGYG